MSVVVITPPSPVLTLAEAKRHLRVEHADDDDLISGLLAAAQGQIDGPGGWLGRAVGAQMLEATGLLPNGCDRIILPFPPVLSVLSVTDARGVSLDASAYALQSAGVLAAGSSGTWPQRSCSGFVVRYTAGYPTTPANGDVPASWSGPAPLRAALLLMLADLYEYRGGKLANTLIENPTIKGLLSPYRVWSL